MFETVSVGKQGDLHCTVEVTGSSEVHTLHSSWGTEMGLDCRLHTNLILEMKAFWGDYMGERT